MIGINGQVIVLSGQTIKSDHLIKLPISGPVDLLHEQFKDLPIVMDIRKSTGVVYSS